MNLPQYTDMSSEIREATAKINAAYERFKVYANSPQPDRATLLQMQHELEVMVNSCPSWINVSCMEPEERTRILSYLKKHNHGLTITPNPRTDWPDAT